MRNRSELERPSRMSSDTVLRILGRLAVGARFRVWYLDRSYWMHTDNPGEVTYDIVILDGLDAEAALSNRPVDIEAVEIPASGLVGKGRLIRTGEVDDFIFDTPGIHHIEILSP